MAGLGSLYIDLLARTGKFETDIGRAAKLAERRAKEIDRSFSRLGSRIAGAFAGLAAGFSLSAIIEATTQAEKAMAALELAVKNNAGAAGLAAPQLANMASELQKLSTFDDEAIMQMQAVLLRFREIGGPEFQRAQTAVIDLATALGTDLTSAATLVGRALADPAAGMSRLSRAGIVLSDEQKELIKRLAETGRMSEAQALLLEQLEARFGGAAQAARNTLGGALIGLKNAFGDLLEAKGGLPEVTQELNKFTALLQDPATAAAADAFTSGIITAFAKVSKVILGTAELFKFLGESAAAALHGPASDDIGRLEAELARLQKISSVRWWQNNSITNRIEFFGKNGLIEWYSDADLNRAIAEIQKKIADFYKNRSTPPAIPTPGSGVSSTSGGPVVAPPPSEEFTKLADKLKEQIALYGQVGKAAEISYAIQSGALDELSKSEQQQLLALARRYDAVVKSADAQKKAGEEQQKAVDEITKMTRSVEEQIATFGMGETAVLEYRLTHGDLAKAFSDGSEQSEEMKQKLIDLTRQLEIMKDAAEGAADAISDFASQNSESLSEGLEAFQDDFEKRFLTANETLTAFQEQAARNTQDIIADTLMDGFDQGVDGILKSFGEMIQKLVAQAVAADIAKRLFGDPAVSGDGWLGIAATAAKTWFGGGRAIGGPVLAGVTYRVNEREPEFFRPRVGGDIIPLSKMPNMGGGTVINQNFSVRPETGDRVTRRTEQQLAAAASRGIAVASRRNN